MQNHTIDGNQKDVLNSSTEVASMQAEMDVLRRRLAALEGNLPRNQKTVGRSIRNVVAMLIAIAVLTVLANAPIVHGQSVVDALFISAEGNVGIGTTNPASKLDVNGAISAKSINVPNLNAAGIDTIINSAAGNVGIGTSSPAFKLHVQDTGLNTGRIQVGSTGANTDAKLISFGDGDLVYIGEKGEDDLMELRAKKFYFNTGNVGIGTSTPSAKLDVRGDIKMGSSGQYFAPAGEENLRIVRGTVNPDGVILAGSGFRATHKSLGVYEITFTSPFAAVPTVTANASVLADTANIIAVTTGSFTVELHIPTIGNTDNIFHFIAIGPR